MGAEAMRLQLNIYHPPAFLTIDQAAIYKMEKIASFAPLTALCSQSVAGFK
jgi:hypothetical protein